MSFLSYVWLYPSPEVEGKYVCEVYGVDRSGHPVVSSAHVNVTEKEVWLNVREREREREGERGRERERERDRERGRERRS